MHCDIAKQDLTPWTVPVDGARTVLTPRTVLTLARVGTGWTRRGLMVGRSGAERADCPAVLAAGAHRTTHCAPCGLFVRTSAMRMLTKRAARAAPAAALLGAPQIAPAGSRLPRRWVIGVRCPGGRGGGQVLHWGRGGGQVLHCDMAKQDLTPVPCGDPCPVTPVPVTLQHARLPSASRCSRPSRLHAWSSVGNSGP